MNLQSQMVAACDKSTRMALMDDVQPVQPEDKYAMDCEKQAQPKDGVWPANSIYSLEKQGNMAPPKPWERVGSSSGPSPFRSPSTNNNTNDVVDSSGDSKPGEQTDTTKRNLSPANASIVRRPMPQRPWERNYGATGYGTVTNYNAGYGTGMYGQNSLYGGNFGGTYGGGLYGNNIYRGGYGGFNGGYGTYGIGGMQNNGFGGPIAGYGMGQGGPYDYGNGDPNNPFGGPSPPPSFWQSMLHTMHGVVTFFGRISILVDQNTQAFHFFITALLQLFDRSGSLYGELARFVLRILRIRTKPRIMPRSGSEVRPSQESHADYFIAGPKEVAGGWDNVWQDQGVWP